MTIYPKLLFGVSAIGSDIGSMKDYSQKIKLRSF